MVGERQQKALIMLSRFWPSKGLWGKGGSDGLGESIKKGKFVVKIFFSENVE